MRPIKISQTGVGASVPAVVDREQQTFAVGFGAVVTGTATYTIEHTYDDPLQSTPVTWFPHATVVAQTASKDGGYNLPVAAIRINITAGTGSVALTVLQTQR